jgi:SAM-dependent methyltransferase
METANYTGRQAAEQPPGAFHVADHWRAEWRLPRGVPQGVWQYVQADHIAEQYDQYFADNRLFQFDEQVVARHLTRPGLVVDLGCGTGRSLVPLARRGFRGLAVDLSQPMLRIVGQKAAAEGLPIHRVQANLVELDCIRSGVADYCTCLFSTLGMVQGHGNRRKVLDHVRRILKPGGLMVAHVHNFWYNVFDAPGRRWLLRHLLRWLLRRDAERGDKFFDYRRIPNMFLHTFTRRELVRSVRAAGFRIKELIPLSATRQRPLRRRWFFGGLRANGWIVVCE